MKFVLPRDKECHTGLATKEASIKVVLHTWSVSTIVFIYIH